MRNSTGANKKEANKRFLTTLATKRDTLITGMSLPLASDEYSAFQSCDKDNDMANIGFVLLS